ncbi:MAG: hypothetical protein M1818_008390 [Claussenomyces sp. TS43310]|nr:MAG: hypothetical protein M1818_008390 [Claussenomyces sp. TS43310]
MAFDSTDKGYEALVFGASGITGWAIVNEALTYPSPNTFARVVGLTHRSLAAKDAHFAESNRLELYSGFDLSNREKVRHQLQKVPYINKITHVYFAAYTGHGSSRQELKRANVEILENAIDALEELCPKLQFFTLQTGGKGYGIEFPEQLKIPVPTPESMPRIPQPFADDIFYYAQYDLLLAKSENKSWKFCEIRPDVIVGFVPQNNAMNAAQSLGLFLTVYKHKEGDGADVPFPDDYAAWIAKYTDTSQDILARFHIFASMHPDRVDRQAFNVADGAVESWETLWAGIAGYFGLKGVPPKPGVVSGADWMLQHKTEWSAWEKELDLKPGVLEATNWEFMKFIMLVPVDRQYDLSRMREVGFLEKINTVTGYQLAFARKFSRKSCLSEPKLNMRQVCAQRTFYHELNCKR